MTITSTELESGITVVTERMADVRSVAAGFWVGTGARDEAAERAGASHFLEHLLFKGTATLSARQIAEAIDEVGGDINAFTTKEYTTFYVRLLSDNALLGLGILSDIMWAPAFRPDEVDAERQVILEEILMHNDEPADLVHEVFTEAVFPSHALGREVIGDQDTVESMTRDHIAEFHAEHYRPSNIVVAVAGDLDHDQVVGAIGERMIAAPGGRAPLRQAPGTKVDPVRVVNRATEQAHLIVGFRSIDRQDEDRHALSIVDHVLGGGMSSRLFQEIREVRGLAYSVYSYRSSYEDAGAFCVYAGTTPAKAPEVLGLIRLELARMCENGVTARELSMAKSHLRGAIALGLEDSGARMSRIGRSQMVHGRVPSLDEVVQRLDAVTLADVGRVAGNVLGGTEVLAAVGPFDSHFFDPS